jgi:hypothetical protein
LRNVGGLLAPGQWVACARVSTGVACFDQVGHRVCAASCRWILRTFPFGQGGGTDGSSGNHVRSEDRLSALPCPQMTFETCVARGGSASAVTPPTARAAQSVAWMSGRSNSAARPQEEGTSS